MAGQAVEKLGVEVMLPDITTIVPSRTGLDVSIFNILIINHPMGFNNWDWDALGMLYTKDDDDPTVPERVAVSIAVKGFSLMVSSKIKRGYVINIDGKWGPIEKSSSGREEFRRIFCELKDIKQTGVVPL